VSEIDWPISGEHPDIGRHPAPAFQARRMRAEIIKLREQVEDLTTRADNALQSAALANAAASQANQERMAAHIELDDLTRLNDRLQNEQAEMLCRIDELTAERYELQRTVAELWGTR
jgi:chromosome segregation ATPase